MNLGLEDKFALATGASKDIGKAAAAFLAAVSEIKSSGGEAHGVSADMASIGWRRPSPHFLVATASR